MTTDPQPSKLWLQQLVARLTGRGEPEPAASPSRYASSPEKTPAEVEAARSEARAAMQAFRAEHVRTQGGGHEAHSPVQH
jgi:hypothetical protein